VKESRITIMARRGLIFPQETRAQIRKTGIRCRPQIEIVFQHGSNEWKLRGEESGGAVADLGHYVGYVGLDGEPLSWLQRVQNFLPNGLHAVVVERVLARVEMFRYENTYDLLITRHSLESTNAKRREMKNEILFLGRNGTLATELWGQDSAFRGAAMPHFFKRNGEQAMPQSAWLDAALRVTEGVCCTGCRHVHLLEAAVAKEKVEVQA
jgi:hypothetical protein